jgi:chromosome segregation ATPase
VQGDAAQLRAALRSTELELEKAKKENEVLRVTSAGAVASTATALQGGPASTERAELVEAQKKVRRLEAELEATRMDLAKQMALAADAQQRARQERSKMDTVGSTRVEAAETALHLSQARKATEDVRRVLTRQDGVRRQLAGTLTAPEAVALMEQHSRGVDSVLRALEAHLGMETAGAADVATEATAAGGQPLKSPKMSADTAAEVRIQTLKLENSRLQQALNQSSSDLADVKGKLEVERRAHEEAMRLVGIEKSRAAFSEQKLDERLANERQLQDARDALERSKAHLEQQLSVEKARSGALAAELTAAQAAKTRLEQQLAAEKVRNGALAAEAAEAHHATKLRLEEQHAARTKLEQQLAAEQARSSSLNAQLNEAHSTKVKLEEQHTELRARSAAAGEAETAKTKLEQQLAAEQARNSTLSAEVAETRARLATVEAELSTDRERHATEARALYSAVEEARRMADDVLAMEKQRAAKLEEERSASAAQEAALARLEADKTALAAALEQRNSDVARLREELAAVESRLRSEQDLTLALRKAGESSVKETKLEALNRALQAKVLSIEEEIDRTLDEMDAKTADLEAAQAALAAAQTALQAEKQASDARQAEILELRKSNASLQEALHSSREVLESKRSAEVSSEQQQQKSASLEQEMAQTRASLDAFQKALSVADATLAAEKQRSRDALEAAEKDKKRLEQANQALQERNMSIQQELLRANEVLEAKQRALESAASALSAAAPATRDAEGGGAAVQQLEAALREEQKRSTKFAMDLNQMTADVGAQQREQARIQALLQDATRNVQRLEMLLGAEKVRTSALNREVEMHRSTAEDVSALRDQLDEERERALALSTEIVMLKRVVDDAKRDRATLEIALATEKDRAVAVRALL